MGVMMNKAVENLEAHYASLRNPYSELAGSGTDKDVYLVYGLASQVLGVFSQLSAAKEYQDRVNGISIGVMTIDAELPFLDTPLTLYRINVTRGGHITAMYKKPPPMYKPYWHDDVCYWEGYAENADDAISAALAYVSEYPRP
jgi:hypothetical protein